MKAVVNTEYGSPDVLKYMDVAVPAPKNNEVLIRVHAASVNAADWRVLRARPFLARLEYGLRKPNRHILGCDVAGIVEAVGSDVRQFKPGDAVFGDIMEAGAGAFAEYVSTREDVLVEMPANVSFEDAATAPLAGVTALQGLRTAGRLQPGQHVVIYGASGGVGTFAVQIAKALGAEVTAVCSTRNVEMARALGADHVIDYKREDFTKNGQQYDLILGINGYHPLGAYKRSMRPQGSYVMIGGTGRALFEGLALAPLYSKSGGRKFGHLSAHPNTDDLAFLANLMATGKVKAVIDRRFPLSGVPDAIRYMENEHTRGKVVIVVGDGDGTGRTAA